MRASQPWSGLPACSRSHCWRSLRGLLQKNSALLREPYLSPVEIAASPDGRLLYVVCQDSDEVRVIEAASGKVVKSVPVGHMPRGIAITGGGDTLYVTNAWSDKVSVVDANKFEVVKTFPAGFEPSGVALDSTGKTLYVANRLSNDVSVIDLSTGQETKRLRRAEVQVI